MCPAALAELSENESQPFFGYRGAVASQRSGGQREWLAIVAAAYLLIAAAYTWPLLPSLSSAIPSDSADPVFNASILRWNASVRPFSAAWWNAPHYFPTLGVAAFTENLVGLSLMASPIIWLSGNAIVAYNVAFFLTWPLSGVALFLLVRELTRRHDAAFLAGLAFAFTPYRTTEIAHIQSLSAYWLPVALFAAHRYLREPRRRWLGLFGVSWLVQALSNGHFMLFGAVVLGAWLVYFCATPARWRAGTTLVGTWALASVPLVPVMLRYSSVHTEFGLKRTLAEVLAYSARPHAFVEVTGDIWFWRQWLPTGKDMLFPGVTALWLVLVGVGVLLVRHRGTAPTSWTRRAAWMLAVIVCGAGVAATLAGLVVGPFTTSVAGLAIRMRDVNRAVGLTLASGAVVVLMSPAMREPLRRRSALVFYSAMTLLVAVLCTGPVLHVGDTAMLSPAPYRWLMALPGFDELRVPPRFWMLGILCLSVAAGLAYAALVRVHARVRPLVGVVVGALLLVDGWMPTMRMAPIPSALAVESDAATAPILELPLGPDWDWDAVYRSAGHHRRVFNGVSGYDPPHYDALRAGLAQRDPELLRAIASLASVDVVVNTAADADGAIARYVAGAPGARLIRTAEGRGLYQLPRQPSPSAPGPRLPLASVRAFRLSELLSNVREDAVAMNDGRLDTGWSDYPQRPGQWIEIDTGAAQPIAGVTQCVGRRSLAFPRQLEIQASLDGRRWERAWDGGGFAPAFLALVERPLEGCLRVTFPAISARYVRVLQTGEADREWHIAELSVHAPQDILNVP